MKSRTFLIMILSFFSQSSWSAPQCINDLRGFKKPQNQVINNSLAKARDPLTLKFRTEKPSEPCLPCGSQGHRQKMIPDLKALRDFIQPSKIKKECIVASLQRETAGTGYSCATGHPQAFDNAGATAPCLNSSVADFLHYSLNQALSCLSPKEDPVDPRQILQKINNETAFHFFLASKAGVGQGQLTSYPVKEIAGWYNQKKEFIPGQAYYLMEKLMASKNPACDPFKKIVSKDAKTPPPLPGTKANYCRWLSVGEGLGRNLFYSLAYYIYVRDQIVKEELKEKAPALVKNKELVNALTLISYGPQGPAEARSLIHTLRLNNQTKPIEARKKLMEASSYLRQTQSKMAELINIYRHGQEISPEDLQGDSCVEY